MSKRPREEKLKRKRLFVSVGLLLCVGGAVTWKSMVRNGTLPEDRREQLNRFFGEIPKEEELKLLRFWTRAPSSALGLDIPSGGFRWGRVDFPGGSCAVVGSSANLRHARQGSLIDSFDQVIRINRAPTSGFENDVGARTDFYLYSGYFMEAWLRPYARRILQWEREVDPSARWLFPFIPALESMLDDARRGAPFRVPFSFRQSWYIPHEFNAYVARAVNSPRDPSTGVFAVMFAVHFCDRVGLFGLGPHPDGYWDYYYKPDWKPTNHDTSHEIAFIKKVSSLPFVAFYPGNTRREKPESSVP